VRGARVITAAAVAFGVLFAAETATAHHDIPRQAVLAKVYPDLLERTKAETPFRWSRFMARAESRWRATHPAAERRHLELARRSAREAMWLRVASCESGDGKGAINWDVNTGNGYYGGLQMDRTFQQTYDPDAYATLGTANNWPAWRQMRAADRAYESRGLAPWPNCGHARLGYKPVP
jgi:hypothetical protein